MNKRNLQADLELCESIKDRRYVVDVFVDDGNYDDRLGCVKSPTKTKKDSIAESYVIEAIQGLPWYIKEVRRLRELAKAEAEGRLVALPCRPGDKLYDEYGRELVLFSLEVGHCGVLVRTVPLGGGVLKTYRPSDFGKTVFLNRELCYQRQRYEE